MLALKKASLPVYFIILLMLIASHAQGNADSLSFDLINSGLKINEASGAHQRTKGKIEFRTGRKSCRKDKKLSYYLKTADFINSFIEIPTSNVLVDSSTISSKYLAGRAPVYNQKNEKVGTCSASFLCM